MRDRFERKRISQRRRFDAKPADECITRSGKIRQRPMQLWMLCQRLPDTVALLERRTIAQILTPGNPPRNHPLTQFLAAKGKQRTQDRHARDRSLRRHTGKPCVSAAAEEALEDRLRLIVRVVGDDHTLEFM